ncbi:nuclear transport factor 2 family protein [Scytonema millei]|uniref:Nuclear transport factor 2 family protein n=1 Tax=Scytonema millei VB511283 TaxID=1245923 RepID=A0A9X5E959_9CYAN|nr:nuclear transport factor 2 family protein [Scytonema millei]NHC36409.1 nuclear transport factor 2 family protein [Scytonema millei VB511283]
MSQQNVENVRRLFQAVEERDIAGVLAAYAPEIVIRDAESLPYGGIHHGLEGAKQHVEGAAQTWNHLQPPAERKMDAVFLDVEDYIIVLWRLKGLAASSGRKLDLPVVSVYKMRDGKILESQMFYSDTVPIQQFLESLEAGRF